MNTLQVTVKNVYGVDSVYPVCERAKLFASIAGTKTLTPEAIKHIKSLGYTFELTSRSITI